MQHFFRRTPRAGALAAALGALVLLAGPRPPTAAQTTPPLRLEADLWAAWVSVPALPGQFVEAEIRRPNGSRLIGVGSGDADGRAVLDLFNVEGGQGGPAAVQPGDTVRIAQSGRRPLEIIVPALSATVDAVADRLSGTAPAGANVSILAQLELTGPDGAVLWRDVPTQAVAGPDGTWSADLRAEGVDLPAGRTRGRAWIETVDHDRFFARFNDTRLDATLGAYEVRGLATPGHRVRGTIAHTDGSTTTLPERAVIGDGAFSLGAAGFGRFASPPPDARPLRVGDRIELKVSGTDGGEVATLALVLPGIAVSIDTSADLVRGTAPADTNVRVEATSLDGVQSVRVARTGADGAFAADFRGTVDLGPGWLAKVSVEPSPSTSAGAVAVVPQARVGVGLTSVRGLAEPGTPITVTLRGPNGAQRRMEPGLAGATGSWTVNLADFVPGGDDEVEVRAGDRIEITSIDGDPVVANVPTLTALADADTDSVGGTAPPGARLRVVAAGRSVTATADGSGRWTASFAGSLDVAAPMGGEVWLADGAFAFYTTWSVVRLNVELGGNFVTGNGPRGRAIDAVLRDADGKVVATAHGRVFDRLAFGGAEVIIIGAEQDSFYLDFLDLTGASVPIEAGDVLQVTAGDQTVSFVVPALDGAVFVADDVISGRTRAGATVRIRVQRDDAPAAEATTTAGADGTFSHRFAPGVDLLYNDFVQLEADVSGHRVSRYVGSPGIQVDLDRNTVQGQIAPDARVRIEVKRGGAVLAGVESQTGPLGFYFEMLSGAAGRPLSLRQGDVVTVTAIEPSGTALTMTLPELTVDADEAANTVGGRATPGGSLAVLANDQVGDSALGFGQAWPEIVPSGTWQADFVPALRVRPGLAVNAQYRTPEGHIALRTRIVPLLSAEHGGANVCGWSAPSGAVRAELRDVAGRVKGNGTTEGAWWDGAFHAVLRDGAGAAVTSATSETVSADLSGTAVQVALPGLDVAMDWTTRRLTGTVPRGVAPEIQFPALRCGGNLDVNGSSIRVGFRLRFGASPDGRVDSEIPLPIEAGQGFEIALRTAGGHRVFKQFWRSQVEAYLATPRAAGTTNSQAAVTLTLKGADGTVKGTAIGAADPSGRFDLMLRDAAGEPVAIAAGDTLTAVGGGDSAIVPIDALSFDWSPGGAVSGLAPAGRDLRLTLRLADGRRLSVPRTADANGRWAFTADEVPVRGGWTLDDVTAVRVALRTAGGHNIIDQSSGFEAPDEPPAERGGVIYLPALLAKAALGGTRAVAGNPAAALRSSVLRPRPPWADEPQSRPDVVADTQLVVDEAGGQADRPDRLLIDDRRPRARRGVSSSPQLARRPTLERRDSSPARP